MYFRKYIYFDILVLVVYYFALFRGGMGTYLSLHPSFLRIIQDNGLIKGQPNMQVFAIFDDFFTWDSKIGF